MRLLLLLAIVLLLTGASCSRNVRRVPAMCDQICFLPCVSADGDVGIRWEADPLKSEAWDALGEDVTAPLATALRQCEIRRKACDQCLRRLDKEEVIGLGR